MLIRQDTVINAAVHDRRVLKEVRLPADAGRMSGPPQPIDPPRSKLT